MALTDEVQTRISATLLKQITNKHSPAATAIDSDVLAAAAADAEAEFAIETGITFDVTVASHVAAGVKGTLYYLYAFADTTGPAQERRRTDWERLLRKLAGTIGAEQRLLPQSNSPLEPSEQRSGSRPDFDRQRWNELTPDMPDGADESDRRRGY